MSKSCKIKGCDKGICTREYEFCRKHYMQFKRGIIDAGGKQLRELKRASTYSGVQCKVEGCSNHARSRGFCAYHYPWFRKGILDEDGNQLRPLGQRPPKNGYKTIQRGYVKKMCKGHPNADRDGYVLEHRLVMEEHLGRYLTSEEVVHHISGVRDDNRLENLQLMGSRKDHPPFFERVNDVEAAVEALDRLVHRSMTGGPELKKRLQKIARRLPVS